jgi:hypothetical protein
MKRVTTNDLLKDVLSQRGGNINDWKRLSRRKDEVGRIVREFKNSATGQVLEITQVSDSSHLVSEKTPGTEQSAQSNPLSPPGRGLG